MPQLQGEIMNKLEKLKLIPGFYAPCPYAKGKWEVTLEDGSIFTLESQTDAEIIARLVELKNMLNKQGVKSDLQLFNEREDANEVKG